ncbi:MAG: tRNA lysidine(34) synthetase TilS, partial [Anaerolineales bacterium]
DPFGMEGKSIKISDIFINRKIPQDVRSNYPLICDTQRIIWLPGYTISDSVRITPVTKNMLHLIVEKKSVDER